MSGRSGDRLERRLGELGSGRRRRAKGPELDLSRRAEVTPGELIAGRDEREDPLTGHRGIAEGVHVLVRAGSWIVDMQLRDESEGVVLRGQVLPAEEGLALSQGALVHATTGGEARMACVGETGEFVLRGLPAAGIERLLLELEDTVHQLPWPSESSA